VGKTRLLGLALYCRELKTGGVHVCGVRESTVAYI